MSQRTFTFLNLLILVIGIVNLSSAQAAGDFAPISSLSENNRLAESKNIEYNHPASGDESYAKALDGLNITLHPGSEFTQENTKPSPRSLNRCKSLVYRTLKSLPSEASAQLKNLTLYFSSTGRRGLGGGSTIVLRCENVTDAELVGVFVHEMGHITDTGVLKGSPQSGESEFMDGQNPVYNNDPSLSFYRLSFQNEKTQRPTNTSLDFVSGYARSDAFEDFAESYNFYLLHGNEFRRLIKTSKVLYAKYVFLKTRVFHGKEFENGDEARKLNVAKRDYDTTVLAYDLNRFFAL